MAEGLKKKEYPLKLDLHRAKTGGGFLHVPGQRGNIALKAYLADMKQRGVIFTHSIAHRRFFRAEEKQL